MTAVTVDLADLETLIFATAAIKSIEDALAARRRDPFMTPHLNYTEAHNRLVGAMREAQRSASNDTLVKYDEPLTKPEIGALRYVDKACSAKTPGLALFVIATEDKAAGGEAMSVYDRLAAKGCIEMGQFVQGVVWAGANTPQITADPKGYAARLTNRGRSLLAATKVL